MDNKKIMPLFKYIGGKGWLREKLRIEVDKILSECDLNTYMEPFAGGLGAFLNIYDLLSKHDIKKVLLNDINFKLINLYNIVNTQPDMLIKQYMDLENSFINSIPKEAYTLHKTNDKDLLKQRLRESESIFKEIRCKFNNHESTSIELAKYLLFLQNHCFNGVYRENFKGEYNTPFNWETRIFTEEKIAERVFGVNKVLKNFEVIFSTKTFEDLEYDRNTLFYIDPPYLNGEETRENKYNKNGFDLNKQKLLIQKIKDFNFIYSNHESDLLEEEFDSYGLTVNIQRIPRKNIISASNESRKNDKIEILVTHLKES